VEPHVVRRRHMGSRFRSVGLLKDANRYFFDCQKSESELHSWAQHVTMPAFLGSTVERIVGYGDEVRLAIKADYGYKFRGTRWVTCECPQRQMYVPKDLVQSTDYFKQILDVLRERFPCFCHWRVSQHELHCQIGGKNWQKTGTARSLPVAKYLPRTSLHCSYSVITERYPQVHFQVPADNVHQKNSRRAAIVQFCRRLLAGFYASTCRLVSPFKIFRAAITGPLGSEFSEAGVQHGYRLGLCT
jgi:hypothetical protein